MRNDNTTLRSDSFTNISARANTEPQTSEIRPGLSFERCDHPFSWTGILNSEATSAKEHSLRSKTITERVSHLVVL